MTQTLSRPSLWRAAAISPDRMAATDLPRKKRAPGEPERPALTARLRELFGDRSDRKITLATGVNHVTVNGLKKGTRSSPDSLVKIAVSYGINPNELLALADFEQRPIYDLEFGLTNLPPDSDPKRTEQAVSLFNRWWEQNADNI